MHAEPDLGELEGVVRTADEPPPDYPTALFSLAGDQLAWMRGDRVDPGELTGEYVVLVTGGKGDSADGSPPRVTVETVERTGVRPPDPRQPLRAAKGGEVTVELPGYATRGGYEW